MDLGQCLSNCNVLMNHLTLLRKSKYECTRSGTKPRRPLNDQIPGCVDEAGPRPTLWVARESIIPTVDSNLSILQLQNRAGYVNPGMPTRV